METQSKLRHPNIVQILGYCSTSSDRVLIYEFMEKGSLDQWLPRVPGRDGNPKQAPAPQHRPDPRALLHGFGLGPIIRFHGEGQPRSMAARHVFVGLVIGPVAALVLENSNEDPDSLTLLILGLLGEWNGLHSYVVQVAGTMGYMPPEYIHGCFVATAMGDVYSFGILMLEIATGVQSNLPFKGDEDGKEVRLVEWARKMEVRNRQMEILDANVSREGIKEAGVVAFFRIAMLCTSETRNDRPVMKKVGELLSQILT
ncbi:protein kinase superfamily protein [Actinidia rufa]|uniref:Protein kinase superfamily protein n=1 Tax=Actinidia rufa TaxID=165716 RepID=A0A7J0GGM2_9ERIC|nr:protein kinase superfamily protein [Actinidia rufa]